MEEKTFVGFNFGRFKNDSGAMQDYCNVFLLEPFEGSESDDYHFGGQKAVKYRCTDPDLFKDLEFGAKVQCYFDSRKRISFITLA